MDACIDAEDRVFIHGVEHILNRPFAIGGRTGPVQKRVIPALNAPSTEEAEANGQDMLLYHSCYVVQIQDMEKETVGFECPECGNRWLKGAPIWFQDAYQAWGCSKCNVLIPCDGSRGMPSVLYRRHVHILLGISPVALMRRHTGSIRPASLPHWVTRTDWLLDKLEAQVRRTIFGADIQSRHLEFTDGYPLVYNVHAPQMELAEQQRFEADLDLEEEFASWELTMTAREYWPAAFDSAGILLIRLDDRQYALLRTNAWRAAPETLVWIRDVTAQEHLDDLYDRAPELVLFMGSNIEVGQPPGLPVDADVAPSYLLNHGHLVGCFMHDCGWQHPADESWLCQEAIWEHFIDTYPFTPDELA
jgi:hypothetical protein